MKFSAFTSTASDLAAKQLTKGRFIVLKMLGSTLEEVIKSQFKNYIHEDVLKWFVRIVQLDHSDAIFLQLVHESSQKLVKYEFTKKKLRTTNSFRLTQTGAQNHTGWCPWKRESLDSDIGTRPIVSLFPSARHQPCVNLHPPTTRRRRQLLILGVLFIVFHPSVSDCVFWVDHAPSIAA